MKVAFVMYKNLGEWLSPGTVGTQSAAAAAAAADSHLAGDAEYNDDDGCSLDENISKSCTVVNSHIVSLATSSSIRHSVHLSDPVTLILSHIHVCIAFVVY